MQDRTTTPRPSNAVLAELLVRAAAEPERTDRQRRALRRAGRAAFRWPVEASDLVAAGGSPTELRFVGPWIAHLLCDWIRDAGEAPVPPPIRRGFATRTEVERILRPFSGGSAARGVRGDLQTHTFGSDGTASIRDMALAARGRGLEYLAITDHSKGLAIANGMDEAQLARQGEEIRRVESELAGEDPESCPPFRILRAVEMNLSPDGEGDLDRGFLAGLDLVLGAFHSRLRVTEDQTERYLAALANPAVHVLAHPRGRIYDLRVGLRADWPRVFAFAREQNRAVEVDGYPDRQDLDADLLEIARDAGTLISLGSDAHATGQLEFLDFGVAAVRRAGIPEEQILNAKTAEELLAWAADVRRSAR